MKLTELQERALVCLYRRAVRRVALIESVWLTDPLVSMELSAGKQTGVTEPPDLLRWDRMAALWRMGLLQDRCTDGVQLTTLGCQVAREMEDKNDHV